MPKRFLSNINISGSLTATSHVSAGGNLISTASAANEGGQIELALPSSGSTLSGTNVTIDVYQNRLRFFESGGTNRGFYLDLTAGGTTVGTNLAAGGSSYTAPTLAGTTLSSGGTIDTLSGTLTADKFIASSNNLGTNFRVGDDAWIGDINLGNTLRVKGVQDSTQGYIVFGDSDSTALGRTGTGALTYGGNTVWHAGNDGSGSGLDADTLDGNHASAFATNAFTTISTTSGTSPVADSTSDTLTLTAGSGVTVTGDSTTDAVTFALASAYGDTVNPYGSKTANFVLAAPNGSAGVPSFRALVSADIPQLGNITNAGAIGLTSNRVIQTTTSGVLTTVTGTSQSATTFLRGDLTWVTPTDTNWYPTAFTWTGGTTAGPTGSLTGTGMSAVSYSAIPSASASASGIVTTAAQTFAGVKSMTSPDITTSLTTPSTIFALVNTTATTVNFAGAATTLSIGAATGTTTINNANTVVTGDLAVNGGDITTTAAILNIGTTNASTTTVTIGGATATVTVPGKADIVYDTVLSAGANGIVYAGATAPTSPAIGDIWIDDSGSNNGTNIIRWRALATSGQTAISGTDTNGTGLQYTAGYEQVYINGVLLYRGTDYTATDGSNITLTDALILNDTIEVVSPQFVTFLDHYTQAQSDAKYVAKATTPAFRLYQAVAQSIPTATNTALTFDAEDLDTDNGHSLVTNTSRYTATVAGWYSVIGTVQFAYNATGNRLALILKNGTTTLNQVGRASSASTNTLGLQVSTLVYMNGTTDYIELVGYQSSGGALNTLTANPSIFEGYWVRS